MKTTETVAALLRGKVEAMGYDLYDVAYQKEQSAWVLTLYIDKPGGVDIDDCEAVSRAVEPMLDEADPIAESYFLSVSSIGLDRPLRLDKDFARNVGQKITVKLYAPVDKKKEFTGVLTAWDAESFTLDVPGDGPRAFARREVAKAQPYIDFKDI